jgi:hypothetical protein
VYSIFSHACSRIGLGHAAVVVAAGLFVGATSVLSQSPAQPGTPPTNARDATSEAALRQQMQKSKRMSDFKGAFEPAPQVKPDLTPSLYKKSIILFDGDVHTVVPMGAVLHLPQNYRSRIIDKPKGALLMWPSFLKKNKDWVGGWEVSMAMAKGDPDLAKNVLKQTAQDTRVLVSVYKGNPITTLAPVPEQTSEAKR